MARASNNWYYDLIKKRLSISHGSVFAVVILYLSSLLWGYYSLSITLAKQLY